MTDIEFCPNCGNLACDCESDIPTFDHQIAEPLMPEVFIKGIIPEKDRIKDPTICEICGSIDQQEGSKGWFKYNAMYMCPSCRDKEMALSAKNAANADSRVAAMNACMEVRLDKDKKDKELKAIEGVSQHIPVDSSIKVRNDFFNAEIVSIINMKKEIDADSSIEKKHFELALRLQDRFIHLRNVLFNIDEKRVSITSEQRGIQTYLNDLVSKLRLDEREKIKQQDLTYQPVIPKKPRESQARAPKKPKFDKVELARLAKEIGIPEFTIQTICVAKGISPVEAAKMLKGLQS